MKFHSVAHGCLPVCRRNGRSSAIARGYLWRRLLKADGLMISKFVEIHHTPHPNSPGAFCAVMYDSGLPETSTISERLLVLRASFVASAALLDSCTAACQSWAAAIVKNETRLTEMRRTCRHRGKTTVASLSLCILYIFFIFQFFKGWSTWEEKKNVSSLSAQWQRWWIPS